jgi:hypothetical protein
MNAQNDFESVSTKNYQYDSTRIYYALVNKNNITFDSNKIDNTYISERTLSRENSPHPITPQSLMALIEILYLN